MPLIVPEYMSKYPLTKTTLGALPVKYPMNVGLGTKTCTETDLKLMRRNTQIIIIYFTSI